MIRVIFAIGLSLGLTSTPFTVQADGPKLATQETWEKFQKQPGWLSIVLDSTDPTAKRIPHYYEDIDGLLYKAGAEPALLIEESQGFPVRKQISADEMYRYPLGLAVFVKTKLPGGPMMARIIVSSSKTAARDMALIWNGQRIGSFDTAGPVEAEKVFVVTLPAPQKAGVQELRITVDKPGSVYIKRISIGGQGDPEWSPRPLLPAGASLKVLSAYYMADPKPPANSQTVEGLHKKKPIGMIFPPMQRLYEEHLEFGGLRVVLHNDGKVPIRITKVRMNGDPIEESYLDLKRAAWNARGVVWYRTRPRQIEPNGCGQFYVRFRRRPAGPSARIEFELENNPPVKVDVPYTNPSLMIDYVTTGKQSDVLYVYARRFEGFDPGRLTSLNLDGVPVKNVTFYGRAYPGGVALAVARLRSPLKANTYHTVGVKTEKSTSVAAQFRVMPFFFTRSSYNMPSAACPEANMNLAMQFIKPFEQCEEYDIYTSCVYGQLFQDIHPRVMFMMGYDEPDAHDGRYGDAEYKGPDRYARALGYMGRMMVSAGWNEILQRFSPHVALCLTMNGTTRPLNWAIYGQYADMVCFDPYPVTYYGADHTFVRESMMQVRRCGMPNRPFAVLEAYGWSKGTGPTGTRGPTPAEYRQNVVQAIGAGMKGLTSWVYSGRGDGWGHNEPGKAEIRKMNRLIEHIEAKLLIGTPVDLASNDAGLAPAGCSFGNSKWADSEYSTKRWMKDRVWTGALLCGPDTIVIAAANHIAPSCPEPPTIEPAKNVTITVKLPDFLPQVTAHEATEGGLVPYAPSTIQNGHALLKLEAIESGRVFVLQRHHVTR